jgi:thioredoxin reductase
MSLLAVHGFEVLLSDGALQRSRKVPLATGVKDILPPIEGFTHLWANGVFHCPY